MTEPRIRPIVLAVIRKGDRVLVFDDTADVPFCRPPGGGIEFWETSLEALRREVLEEIGAAVAEATLLGVIEERFVYIGEHRHEVAFIYAVRLADPSLYALDTILGDEGGAPMPLRWHDPGDPSPRLVPEGLGALLEHRGETTD